jgi:hypothetical protein
MAINPQNNLSRGFFLLLLPAAFSIVFLFSTWRFLLLLAATSVGYGLWEGYQWAKVSDRLTPTFQQLVSQNQGEVSAIELAMGGKVSGDVAIRFLEEKAQEFGTSKRVHSDRGAMYYFVTVGTLGAIFDASETEDPPVSLPVATTAEVATPVAVIERTAVTEPPPAVVEVVAAKTISQPELVTNEPVVEIEVPVVVASETATPIETPATKPAAEIPTTVNPLTTILQSELAKRLDVHSSTIYKRRNDPDFREWTSSRDPEGFTWAYSGKSKEFYRVDS